MKTMILEVAQKLALITNRPIEEFLRVEVSDVVASSENQQEKEERVEVQEPTDEETIGTDVLPIDGAGIEKEIYPPIGEITEDVSLMLKEYGGRLGDSGKIIDAVKTMTKKEYNSITKGMTESELLDHPLLFVMFRSEDQATVNFFEWIAKFAKGRK